MNKSEFVANELTALLKAIDSSWHEVLDLVNTGSNNTGYRNSGDFNSGDNNSGYNNSGYYNSGNFNSGYNNSGNRNSGYYNSGDFNSGYNNSGNRNSGYNNSGNRNSGDFNSGKYNTGDFNSGYWNSCDFSTGFFNTKESYVDLFNHPSNLTRNEVLDIEGVRILNSHYENNFWISSEEMTDEEKEKHPEHVTTGGYIKVLGFKEACKLMWNSLTDEEKQSVREIPYFDHDVFMEITGIDSNK